MANKAFIFETLNDVKGMTAKKQGDFMTLSGVFGVCGVRNNNNRVYETSNYAKMVAEMQERIKTEGGIPGELEHPQMMNITLENISHKITDINIDENGVVSGSITLLNTPKGKIAQAIVEGGLPLYISSRATGCVDQKTGAVTLERLATYDLVGSPGFSQAKLHLNEGLVAESINDNMYYIAETEKDETPADVVESTEAVETAEPVKETNENNIDITNMENKEILERMNALEQRITELETENNSLRESIEKFDVKMLAEAIQNWIVEEYSPMIQKYLVEHYSPEVEKYFVEQIAPAIQNWVVEEYSPVLDSYVKESVKDQAAEMIAESKKNSMSAIESTLSLLESLEATKPTYQSKTVITEAANEPLFVAQMPAEMRPRWDMASKEVKESITRRAKLYNFNNEGAVQRFWESINFDSVKPAATIYEGLDKVEDHREAAIRESLRRWSKR